MEQFLYYEQLPDEQRWRIPFTTRPTRWQKLRRGLARAITVKR